MTNWKLESGFCVPAREVLSSTMFAHFLLGGDHHHLPRVVRVQGGTWRGRMMMCERLWVRHMQLTTVRKDGYRNIFSKKWSVFLCSICPWFLKQSKERIFLWLTFLVLKFQLEVDKVFKVNWYLMCLCVYKHKQNVTYWVTSNGNIICENKDRYKEEKCSRIQYSKST